ncbi:hypothetical protein BD310DRAFT_827822 [Dichomitus squalens]|uniref:Uncharacterized protein n=1 Tax=Dichomitus squalens TaxID=114155 RepID=A0A4Q9PK91_9APHY|nr:hypothetical protein BD310DRAFT_827822 [Dichomitus squalens]
MRPIISSQGCGLERPAQKARVTDVPHDCSLGSRRSTALSAPALDASLRSASPGREEDKLGRKD